MTLKIFKQGNEMFKLGNGKMILNASESSRTIINLSEPIWEALGVGQISRLDQKVMYVEGKSQRIGYKRK